MYRLLLILLLPGLCGAAEDAAQLTWHRRSLRNPSAQGYTAAVRLAGTDAASCVALACESEGVELRAQDGRWAVTAAGQRLADGSLPDGVPSTLFAKRTRDRLMLGVAGQWVYGRESGEPKDPPAVRVGVSDGCQVAALRLVAREPVRFADDFPDPEPRTGLWAPVRGKWALCSLSYATQSANPAELAAVFDDLKDPASEGRTRSTTIGVGLRLAGMPPRVSQVASDSPAARAGVKVNDLVRAVNGVAARTAEQATELLAGDEGEKVKVTVESDGQARDIELARTLIAWGTIRRLAYLEPCRAEREALITVGDDTWTDYHFRCAVHTRGAGAFGLVFAYLGPRDYHAFRWLGADLARGEPGRLQLVRVRAGRAAVLAERAGAFRPADFYALRVAIEGDAPGQVRVRGFVDGTLAVEARDDAVVPGRLGFWAEAPGSVGFDDVAVGQDDPHPSRSRATANLYHRYDPVMRAWGDPAYSWGGNGLERPAWHLADFPGDVTLTAPVRGGQALELAVAATRGEEASGYRFELAADARSLRLERAGTVVAEKPVDGPPAEQITLARTGDTVRVALDGRTLVTYQDPEPLRGCAVWVQGTPAAGVRLDSPNVFEDYFNGAPTEWHAMSGSWEVMNRWVCTPSWSFFGGRSDGLLALWSKRRMDGDCFLDAHIGVMMLSMRVARTGYENMRDVGLTICGDGRNVASGYAAIVGAQRNTLTALYRNGRLVASTRQADALLPKDANRGEQGEIDSQHHGWNHVKLAKEGRRVRLFLWNQAVLDYEDPEPLPGGHAAVWTVDSGLLLAKVRLAASQLGAPTPFFRDALPFADNTLTNDCQDGQTRVTERSGTYEIANTAGGGAFAVALRPRLYSAVERPTLSFAVKLTPDAKVDFYFRCRGKLCRVVLSGPADDPPDTETLGTFAGARPDGQWHTVSFDLLGALRRRFPDDPRLLIWQPEFANHSDRDYLLAGFGGNGAGATYWLRDIFLGPAFSRVASAAATRSASTR